MPRISKEKALNKINGYLQQVSGMQGISYQKGEDLRESMNISIRNFLTLAFDDGNEKVKQFDDYVNTYIVGTGTQETASERQKDYQERLRDAKTFLETWKEELEMVDDTSLLNTEKMQNSGIKKNLHNSWT